MSKQLTNIILYGPPGSGKSTLVELLRERRYPFSLISMGQLLRDIAQQDDELGKMVKSIIEKGELVDEKLVTRIVREKVRSIDKSKTVILDGYPRTMVQVVALEEIFSEAGLELPMLVYIKITKEEAIRRLSGRRVCPVCKENYQHNSSADKEKCPKCNRKLVQREDDKPESITNRFELFEMQFELIKHYFESKKRYIEMDGMKEKEARIGDLLAILTKKDDKN